MEMEVIVERCALLDVHRDSVMACARTPDGHGGRREEVVEFATTTSQLLELADWLAGLPQARRPTAAFCANDLLAVGLLQQSIGMGRRVPDDLAIVGYDDIDFASAAAVPLTSVRQPREELGSRAAGLALDESDRLDHDHEQVVFDPVLVARASTLSSS